VQNADRSLLGFWSSFQTRLTTRRHFVEASSPISQEPIQTFHVSRR
jgi:hypothetical protein